VPAAADAAAGCWDQVLQHLAAVLATEPNSSASCLFLLLLLFLLLP
jgi:hypothetical protein